MSAAKRIAPSNAPSPARLHRRRQRVVVSRQTSPGKAESAPGDANQTRERRERVPTLTGLGSAERSETLFDVGGARTEPPPVSGTRRRRVRLPPPAPPVPTPRPPAVRVTNPKRPVALLDGVHDALGEAYLEEAERLVESGLFD